MANDFLTGLANQLEGQFGLGENQNRSLDIVADGTSQRYGKLGDFAKKFDQSQQRQYLQEGYLRTDPYNATPNQLEIMFQEPDITVLVKKRAFTALADNYQLDHMNKDEKLFYKATKILFANKCKQIAALERLSKVQRVSAATGVLSNSLIPIVIGLVDELNSSFSVDTDAGVGINSNVRESFEKLRSVIDRVKAVYSFSASNFYTTWLVDSSNPFKNQYGQGTGVIEFCNVTSVNTTTTTNFEGGRFDLTISDPYNMMLITNSDIERALSDATNIQYNHKVFQFGQDSAQQTVNLNVERLNKLRGARGARPIQFLTNPDSLLGKKVTALFTSTGDEVLFTYNAAAGLAGISPSLGGVMISPECFRGSPTVGEEGLDNNQQKRINTAGENFTSDVKTAVPSSEAGLFCTVVQSIFNLIQLQLNAKSITTKQNASITNYARKKLRLHYLAKTCIQSMDEVHIYTGSKSRIDNKILGGLQNMFTGLGFYQKIDKTASDFKNQFEGFFNPNSNVNFQLEKSIFAGPDFPNWLWSIMRNVFVNETSGVHTFGGVVSGASSSFSNGSYSVSVSGSDMTYYLQQGMVNFKPSVDVFNGPLYDPLTPFKTSSDAVTNNFQSDQYELLDENKEILASKIIRNKQGPFAGQLATEKNHSNADGEHQHIGAVKKTIYSPDGFKYKWKEGIGTFTHLSNSFIVEGDSTVGSPAITSNPFAGQDVMNAISLCITGQPYNYATFYKAARGFDNFGRDSQTGQDSAFSYYKSLTRDLAKNNALWGNFIPFKNLVVDEATFQKIISSQMTILNANDQVNSKLKQIQVLTSQLQFILKANQSDPTATETKLNLQKALHDQQLLLQKQLETIQNQISANQGKQGLNIIGNDVSFDTESYLNDDPGFKQSLSQPSIRKELRRKINFLTRRQSWQVRSNEDKNLFIIDDSYDKDYDIQVFEKTLGDMKLFDSEFTDVKGKVQDAAKLLNFDVYCDPQGNLRVRPPQYNRMPSSVFYKLFQLKEQQGIQLFPQFLEELFVNQLKGLQNRLETIEDQIRLDGALLGAATDDALYTIIRGGQQSIPGSDNFSFLTDESSGSLSNFDQLYTEANPDKKIELLDNTIEGQLGTQAGITNTFGAIQRSQFILKSVVNPLLANSEFFDPQLNGQTITNQIAQQRLDTVRVRLRIKTGQDVNIDDYQINDFAVTDAVGVSSSNNNKARKPDVFKISNDIAVNIGQRQSLIKQLSKALTNAKESISLDSSTSQLTANSLLMPNISPNAEIPELFENMIEDESYDDLGPNSGRRYVIEDHQIIQFTISENPPEYTMVEVNGQIDLSLSSSDQLKDAGSFTPGGGNSSVSAAAVDYDLWSMYGFKNGAGVAAPFLSNPETQCAPYAATILSRARKNIFRGTLTIAGNEYMQPGEVIYIRSRDILFYVNSVSHSFSYGSSFTTTLELTYGHPAGEYIPTTLDVIGKLLYNNRDSTSYINRRQGNAFNQQNVGTIILDRRAGTDAETILLGGNYGIQNIKVLNDILYTTYFAINANRDQNSIVKPSIELRAFYDSSSSTYLDPAVIDVANVVKRILTGSYEFTGNAPISFRNQTLSAGDIIDPTQSAVDISGATEFRSPSQKAVDMISNINSSAGSLNGDSGASIASTLYGYIIDVWITFTNTTSTTE